MSVIIELEAALERERANNAVLREALNDAAYQLQLTADFVGSPDIASERGLTATAEAIAHAAKMARQALSSNPGAGVMEVVRAALEFYATAWWAHPGDSGPGGNYPADPDGGPDEALLEDGGKYARHALAALNGGRDAE